ncbi:hypothetical protein ACXR2W_14090 [Leucobacter sp. HY1908]
MSDMHILAGPNGAGKSTYVERVLGPTMGLPFVNADNIAREQRPESPEAFSYEAAQIAAAVRHHYFQERRSFITETVFSHVSKRDLVAEAVAHSTTFLDNSSAAHPFRAVAELSQGHLLYEPAWPVWTHVDIASRWPG